MKNALLIIFLLLNVTAQGQTSRLIKDLTRISNNNRKIEREQASSQYEWDVIIDSLGTSKEGLYNMTKMFIAETWNSANNVIQNDNKEGGQIVVKGSTHKTVYENYGQVKITNYYRYTIKFYQKDGKVRMIITDVNHKLTTPHRWSAYPVNLYSPFRTRMKSGYAAHNYNTVKTGISKNLQSLVTRYAKYIQQELVVDDNDW